MHDITSKYARCNVNPQAATETVKVSPGQKIGFKLSNSMYHQGPVALYLGQVPKDSTAAKWDGSGSHWFKVRLGCWLFLVRRVHALSLS